MHSNHWSMKVDYGVMGSLHIRNMWRCGAIAFTPVCCIDDDVFIFLKCWLRGQYSRDHCGSFDQELITWGLKSRLNRSSSPNARKDDRTYVLLLNLDQQMQIRRFICVDFSKRFSKQEFFIFFSKDFFNCHQNSFIRNVCRRRAV